MSLSDYRLFLKRYRDVKFDLIFLDPPYRFNVNHDIMEEMIQRGMINQDCMFVSEQEKPNLPLDGFEMKEYRYGQKYVAIYRKEAL